MLTKKQKLRIWLAAVPPFLVLSVSGGVLLWASLVREKTDLRYRAMARQAMIEGDFESARVFYSRLVSSDRKVDPKDEFNWAEIVARGGDLPAAAELIDSLAPSDGTGYPDAHRARAVQLARELASIDRSEGGSERLEKTLQQLRHHLTRSGIENPLQLCDLWAGYYFASGQKNEGLKKVVESAAYDPNRWLAAAVASEQQGDMEQRAKCYQAAEKHFAANVEANPLDFQSRMALTKVLVDTERIDAAENLIGEGLKLTDREELRRTASDLRLYRMSKVKEPLEAGFAEFNRLLAEAVDLDPLNPQAYGQFLAVYQAAKSDEQRTQLRERLERQVAKGDSIAFAHFSLGSIYWLDGDAKNSLWHTEKALEINPDLLDVANNVAWLVSQQENGDLDRALKLIDVAIEKKPYQHEYRDTKGMILMKMERWDEALTQLEGILPSSVGDARRDLHTRLSTIYQALGKESLAKMHAEEAEALKK